MTVQTSFLDIDYLLESNLVYARFQTLIKQLAGIDPLTVMLDFKMSHIGSLIDCGMAIAALDEHYKLYISDEDLDSIWSMSLREFIDFVIRRRCLELPGHKTLFMATAVMRIAVLIYEVTGIDPGEVTAEAFIVEDLGIDSLSIVQIAVEGEDKYGVKIPDEHLGRLRTAGAAAEYLFDLFRGQPAEARTLVYTRFSPAEAYIVDRILSLP